jgi:ubiquinone/menaquinone biosynthesis C-methylase UbiE
VKIDSIREFNVKRWAALAAADALYTQPALDLTEASARDLIDPFRQLPDLRDEPVLCLAAGGGTQSAAFGVLGACVTVADICEAQLERDRVASRRYGYSVTTVLADMRDLSALESDAFAVVYQPYSLNFVPDAGLVFTEVSRVLRPGGSYFLAFANPTALGVSPRDWNGSAYPIRKPYADHGPVECADEPWVYRTSPVGVQPAPLPREYRHTWSQVLNGLCEAGFMVTHLHEVRGASTDEGPGTWAHFTSYLPPWFELWARHRS